MVQHSFSIVWEITCLKDRNNPETFIILDSDGDPDFSCGICGISSNHLPNELISREVLITLPENVKKKILERTHYRTRIGRVYDYDLITLAKKDPRGWRE
jgi:hypothetical protein